LERGAGRACSQDPAPEMSGKVGKPERGRVPGSVVAGSSG
jgi:hypothetical protein